MQQVIIGELVSCQSVPEDAFGTMMLGPCAVEQNSDQTRLQVGILDILGASQERYAKRDELIALKGSYDMWHESSNVNKRVVRLTGKAVPENKPEVADNIL